MCLECNCWHMYIVRMRVIHVLMFEFIVHDQFYGEYWHSKHMTLHTHSTQVIDTFNSLFSILCTLANTRDLTHELDNSSQDGIGPQFLYLHLAHCETQTVLTVVVSNSPVTGCISGRMALAFCWLMGTGVALESSPKLEFPTDSALGRGGIDNRRGSYVHDLSGTYHNETP